MAGLAFLFLAEDGRGTHVRAGGWRGAGITISGRGGAGNTCEARGLALLFLAEEGQATHVKPEVGWQVPVERG